MEGQVYLVEHAKTLVTSQAYIVAVEAAYDIRLCIVADVLELEVDVIVKSTAKLAKSAVPRLYVI